jgi:hypothetical protein
MSQVSSFNLREKQIKCLTKMLTIKSSSDDSTTDQWKILIYDTDCRDIISPLLNINALHQRGVTLYLMVRLLMHCA